MRVYVNINSLDIKERNTQNPKSGLAVYNSEVFAIAVRTESTRVTYKLTQSSITREDKSFTGS